MPLRDVQTIHVWNMLPRDSVILLVPATKMVKTYLFTSSLVHFIRIEPKKMLHIVKNCDVFRRVIQVLFRSGHFFQHSVLNDLEDDYFEQKIRIKPHLRPLDLLGKLISIDFYLMGC